MTYQAPRRTLLTTMKATPLVVLAILLCAACGSNGGGSSAVGDSKAVQAAAQEETDRFTSNDFTGAYDLWTSAAKKLISASDYSKIATDCKLGGIPETATFVHWDNSAKTSATVRVGLGNITNSYHMIVESGAWKWVPNPDSQATYKLGVSGAEAALKKDGAC